MQVLPPQYCVYYTWIDPLKPRKIVASYGATTTEIELTVCRFECSLSVIVDVLSFDVQ